MRERIAARGDAREPSGCDLQLALQLSESLARVGRIEDAIQQYLWIADALRARGDAMLAVSAYRLVGGLAPYCTRTQLRCADAYAEAGHVNDAVAIWDWAAAALAGFGRPLEAASALSRAVQAAPDDVDRRRRLGELYARVGMIDAAVEQLDAAARRLFAAGRTEAYLEVAERLLGLRRDHVPTLRDLARVHIHRRDFASLTDCLRRLLGASRRDPVAGELIVETFVALGRLRAARDAAVVVARTLLARGDAFDRDVARAVVERARRRSPTDARLRELQEELAAEPIDVSAHAEAITEPEARRGDDTPALPIVAARASDDGETNVYALEGRRRAVASEPTRPDVRGAVIEGRFRRVAG